MKIKNVFALATASFALVSTVRAISLDDIKIWTGSGTNRAALVIEWNSPIVFNNSTVAAPIANKTVVFIYAFNSVETGIGPENGVEHLYSRGRAVKPVAPYDLQ